MAERMKINGYDFSHMIAPTENISYFSRLCIKSIDSLFHVCSFSSIVSKIKKRFSKDENHHLATFSLVINKLLVSNFEITQLYCCAELSDYLLPDARSAVKRKN